jgi:hypothetical protein
MAAIVTNRYRVFDAQQCLAAIKNPANNFYVFIGKAQTWADDNLPDVPLDSTQSLVSAYQNMMHSKKVSPTNCILAIRRYDWTSGVVYTQYDDTVNLFDVQTNPVPFYIMTQDFNVYKCISNNNGKPSWVQPRGFATDTFSLPDGYIWKFMFAVSASDRQNYLTRQFIPLNVITQDNSTNQWLVQSTATPGTIENIKVITGTTWDTSLATWDSLGGSWDSWANTGPTPLFTTPPTVNITGDGTGASAIAILSNGAVVGIQILNKGSGYTYANASLSAGGLKLIPIISPPGGHGSSPENELGAYYVIMHTQFIGSESGLFTVANDFRQVGVILNPLLWGTQTKATGDKYSQAITLILTNITGAFSPDSRVTASGGSTGYVMDYDSTTSTIRLLNITGFFPIGNTISDGNGNSARVLLTPAYAPSFKTLSGTLLYLENFKPISRNSSTEDIKIVLEK